MDQIEIFANQLETQRLGYQAISLTHFDDDVEPQIAAGSVVEIGGALFEEPSDESIAGLGAIAVSSDVYIKLTVAGTSATPSATTTPPTWDTAKQGWYSGAERYIGGLYKDAGGNYTDKWLYNGGPEIRHGAIGADAIRTVHIQNGAITANKLGAFDAGGSWTIASGATKVIPAGLFMLNSGNGDGCRLEVFQGAAWRLGNDSYGGGFIYSDGANVRLRGGSPAGTTIYYLKLS